MSAARTLRAVFAGTAALACSSPTGSDEMFFRTLAWETFSGITEPRQEVVRDAATWAQVWAQIGRVSPARPLPALDFAREMVVVVGTGTWPNTCYGVEITSVKRRGAGLHIEVIDRREEGCVCAQAITTPVHAVAVPRTQGNASFEVRLQRSSCQ